MRKKTQHTKLLLLILLIVLTASCAPKIQITEAHYERAERYFRPNIIKEVYHLEVHPNWLPGNAAFWHVTYTADGKRFFLTKAEERRTEEAFDHIAMARAINRTIGVEADPRELPFDHIDYVAPDTVSFVVNDSLWHFSTQSENLYFKEAFKPADLSVSPDGNHQVFVRDYNLFVRNLQTGEERQVSTDGTRLFEYGHPYGWADVIDESDGKRPQNLFVNWSPDSRRFQTYVADLRTAEKLYLLDFTADTLFRPRLLSYYRGLPGDTTLVHHLPVLYDLEEESKVWIDLDPIPHFMNVSFEWINDGQELYALVPRRGFKQADVVCVDAKTGNTRRVVSDSSHVSVEYGKLIVERIGEDRLLMSSERNGWYHMYLFDWHTGALISQLTDGEYVVKQLVHVDKEEEKIYFLAGGMEEGRNPYYDHLYVTGFDGSGIRLLTPEYAHHQASVSPCGSYVLNNYSRVDQPTVSVVRELATGQQLFTVSEANIDNLLEFGWQPPLPFAVKGRDNETDIYGVLYRPANFTRRGSFPLIDYTYSGPHASIVPKSFSNGLINIMVPFTEFGFAVMVVDGMGTSQRSLAFREVSYRNIGGNMECHVKAISQLGKKFPWIDTTRVGIFGHSAGGYDATRAMLVYPEVYSVGVASASNHDHRMEKAWWPEMYMGYPPGGFYHKQSNITNAAKLQGRLLIAHGAIDENVNPSATYKFAEQLIREGKDFDMLILPGKRHSFGRDYGDYFTKVRWNYFINHLLGAEPLHNYKFRTLP